MRGALTAVALALLLAISHPARAATAREGTPEVPLVQPEQVIKVAAAPADAKPKITEAKALELARKYSGFKGGSGVRAKLALYSDLEHPRGEKRYVFPYHKPVLAWVVSMPGASLERKRFERKPPGEKTEIVKCPLHLAIDAESGDFLGAHGDSAPKWTKGGTEPASSSKTWSFAKPDVPPRVTIREVLNVVGHRPSPTGQFFVRYVHVRLEYPKTIVWRIDSEERVSLLPPFRAWIYSQKGVFIPSLSVPPFYKGPRPYMTCSHRIVSDESGKYVMGISYR